MLVLDTACYVHVTNELSILYKTIPDVQLCGNMCKHLEQLEHAGDKSCSTYTSDVFDGHGSKYTCEQFCIYKSVHGVDAKPRCVIEKVRKCDVDMWRLCGL